MAVEDEMVERMREAVERLEECKEFAAIIPEVRTNIVYAKPDAKGPDDVLAVDGRMTVVDGMPHASGRVRSGASSHMARLVIELNKTDSSIRAGMNFASNPNLVEFLEGYCETRKWTLSVVDRANEPDAIRREEGTSMSWKAKEAVRVAGGSVPKILYEMPSPGKEAVTVIVGEDPVGIADEVCKIARLYRARQHE